MPRTPRPGERGQSRTAHCIRLYYELNGIPQIVDVPFGQLTTGYVAQAQADGGVRLRIHMLDVDGQTIDRVVVR